MNDIQTPNQMPGTQNEVPMMNKMPEKKGNGALIGSIIVIVILIVIAGYLLYTRSGAPVVPGNESASSAQTQTQNDLDAAITSSSTATVSDADLAEIEKALSSNPDLSADFKAFDSAQ